MPDETKNHIANASVLSAVVGGLSRDQTPSPTSCDRVLNSQPPSYTRSGQWITPTFLPGCNVHIHLDVTFIPYCQNKVCEFVANCGLIDFERLPIRC